MADRINVPKWLDKYERWQIKVRKDGERKTFTSPIPGRKGQLACQKKADAWLENDIVDGSIRFSVLYDRWIEELKLHTSKSHWVNYEQYGRNYFKPRMGQKKVSALTEQNLQEILLYAHTHPFRGDRLSYKTLKNMRDCLCAFMKYARKNKLSTLFPEALYIPANAERSSRTTFQPNDILTLFSSEMTFEKSKEVPEWFIYAFRFAVLLGLRPGEIAGLQTKRDIDFKNNRCQICEAINAYNEVTSGKTKNARRTFKLPTLALEVLQCQQRMLNIAGVISPYTFPWKDGMPLNHKTYYAHWKRYRDYNSLGNTLCPYEMRHTFFSVNKNIPKQLLKPVAGHGKSFDGELTYSHELDGEADLAAKLINDNFNTILAKGVKKGVNS